MARTTTSAPKHGSAAPHSATGAVVKNKLTSTKFTDMRAASSERMAVTRAKMVEKLEHMKASMSASMARIRHPINPVHRVAIRESAKERKAAATERRIQAVALAKNNSAGKRARIREKRAGNLRSSVA